MVYKVRVFFSGWCAGARIVRLFALACSGCPFVYDGSVVMPSLRHGVL